MNVVSVNTGMKRVSPICPVDHNVVLLLAVAKMASSPGQTESRIGKKSGGTSNVIEILAVSGQGVPVPAV